MMETLARSGLAVKVFTGTALELDRDMSPAAWLSERGLSFHAFGGTAAFVDARRRRSDVPPCFHLLAGSVPVTLHHTPVGESTEARDIQHAAFLALLEAVLDRFHPDIVVNYGGDVLSEQVRTAARARGIVVVFALHNFNYASARPFSTADAVIVPSKFAAEHYQRAFGLNCTVLPNVVDFDRVRVDNHRGDYVTFVNPAYEKGVYVFARIADELGRRRPDIPLLVVEGRGSERTLADCGLDLRVHGNVNLMSNTPDAREFWGVTRLCLMPSLWWENQPLVAIEAMINGIPVVGSNRGGIPETLGSAGITLDLPDRITPFTCELPTAEEVRPWIEATIRLWDDPVAYGEQRRLAHVESQRWAPEVLEPAYVRFFTNLCSR
jgi:glycosyltransferase involved in cell wall biosynthesis